MIQELASFHSASGMSPDCCRGLAEIFFGSSLSGITFLLDQMY